MFFTPTLKNIIRGGQNMVHILCLSKGFGQNRSQELYRASNFFGVHAVQIGGVLANSERYVFEDRFENVWQSERIVEAVVEYADKNGIKNVILKFSLFLPKFDYIG